MVLTIGTSNDDWIITGSDNDTISTGAGNDHVFAGEGDDYIVAEEGKNIIYGESGNDTLVSGGFNKYGEEYDILYGGDGDDTYIISPNSNGGYYNNIIEFSGNDSGNDTVIVSGYSIYFLNDYVENLDMSRSWTVIGVGNELDNVDASILI